MKDLSAWVKTLPKKQKETWMSWEDTIYNSWAKKSGQHLAVYGRTGTGKTQTLYWLTDMILSTGKEYEIWFDSGKSSEFLPLLLFKPIKLLTLGSKGLDIKITLRPDIGDMLEKYGYAPDIIEKNLRASKIVRMTNPMEDTWKAMDPNYINVISYRKFIIDPVVVSKLYSALFLDLIDVAYDHRMKTPVSIVMDELQLIAPSRKNALDGHHIQASSILIANLQQCRSLGVRIVGAAQGYEQVRPAARQAFDWMIAKRGCDFISEQRKLYAFNGLFERCETDSCYFIFPDRLFSDKLHLPYYPDGFLIGSVKYTGHLRGKKIIELDLGLDEEESVG